MNSQSIWQPSCQNIWSTGYDKPYKLYYELYEIKSNQDKIPAMCECIDKSSCLVKSEVECVTHQFTVKTAAANAKQALKRLL